MVDSFVMDLDFQNQIATILGEQVPELDPNDLFSGFPWPLTAGKYEVAATFDYPVGVGGGIEMAIGGLPGLPINMDILPTGDGTPGNPIKIGVHPEPATVVMSILGLIPGALVYLKRRKSA